MTTVEVNRRDSGNPTSVTETYECVEVDWEEGVLTLQTKENEWKQFPMTRLNWWVVNRESS